MATIITLGAPSKYGSLGEFEAHMRLYKEKTKSSFVVLKSDKCFGKNELILTGKAVHWQLKTVPYDGTPFVLLGTKTFVCHQGRDKHAAVKRRKQEEKLAKQQKEDSAFEETRKLMRTSKKTGCPAAIYAVHICRFPDFRIYDDTPYLRRETSAAVRKAISGDLSNVQTEQMFAAYFPHVTEHKHHPLVEKTQKAREPIKNHIKRLTLAGSKEVLKDLVEAWKQDGCNIEYRPSQERVGSTAEKFLLCFQTPWQKRLLVLYGQQMCLLEATYRTSRYSVPIFFIYVRTNVNYIVVGVFVTQSERKEDIKEALEVFKKWNADWNPSNFMVDSCKAEIGALEEVFADSKVILCDFHREKAWISWTKKKDHGVTSKEEVLKMLRAIADSGTAEEFENTTLFLKQHPAWQTNERLRKWFSTKWLCQVERWVNAFKKEDLRVAVYTNSGIERQNETLKDSYLKGYKDCSLSDTITAIVQDFLPRSYQRYIELNSKCSSDYRAYSQNVLPYLCDKPKIVAEHVMTRHQESLMFTKGQVTSAGDAIFKVSSQTTTQQYSQTKPQQHSVFLGSESQMPSCSCKDWQKNLLPCKHFCAVFNLVPGSSWDSLCLAYRENPLFLLDEECLKHAADGSDSSMAFAGHCTTVVKPDSKQQSKARKRQKCCNLLKDLADKIYQLQDESYMDRVIVKLEDILEDVRQQAPRDGSLTLSYTPPSKRRCTDAADHLRPLEKVNRRKMQFSGTVGRRAEMARKMHTSINV